MKNCWDWRRTAKKNSTTPMLIEIRLPSIHSHPNTSGRARSGGYSVRGAANVPMGRRITSGIVPATKMKTATMDISTIGTMGA